MAFAAATPPAVHIPSSCSNGQRSLDTFASVKTADLEGRLATMRLDAMSARWHSSSDDAMAVGTLEFVAATLSSQKNIQNQQSTSPARHFVSLGHLRRQELRLARDDARSLMKRAAVVLTATDAVPCTCFGRGACAGAECA
ncbi:hypothetical protein PINS_up009393 [Pythium insidiosum]|nr:hypothetical protein PINS_up009393 [Pythium insidiosum]